MTTVTADDLEKVWSQCCDRYNSNMGAKAALLAATGAKFPWTVAEENRAAGLAALQKLLAGGSKATVTTASITVAAGPKKTVGETLNEMAQAIYGARNG